MLRVIGTGFPRTGTKSLKLALERLLGGPCYHMSTVFERPADVPTWRRAAAGEPVDWPRFLDGFVAAVDWPPSAFWPELAAAFPDALLVHSERIRPDTWWTSADATILTALRPAAEPGLEEWQAMTRGLLAREIGPVWDDAVVANAAYDRHNAAVRATAPADRLLLWQAGQGWQPLCAALGVPLPDEPFPNINRTVDWQAARAAPS